MPVQDSPEQCKVNPYWFQKFRGRVGVPVSYINYKCPFGLCFIGKIRIDKTYAGELSKWETDPHTIRQRKLYRGVYIFAVVAVLLFLVTFSLAGLLPFK